MPVKVKRLGDTYIVVEPSGKKVKSSGRFKSRKKALEQAMAINANLHKGSKVS